MTDNTLKGASNSQRLIAQHHHAREKTYAKAAGLLLLAVLAGVVIGVAGTVLYFKGKYHRVPPRPAAIAEVMIQHMHDLLGLKPEEESRLKTIIDSHMTEVEERRKATFKEIRTIFNSLDEGVLDVLGPDRYKKWEEDKEKRFGKKRHDRMPRQGKDGRTGGERGAMK